MKIKNVKVYGLEESIIRSGYPHRITEPINFNINDNDIKRIKKLTKVPNGSGHDNTLKGIIVQFDLYYPQYFTPQLQRYHWIDIISSQSKMHSLTKIKNIKDNCNGFVMDIIIIEVNNLIELYNSNIEYPHRYSSEQYFINNGSWFYDIKSKEEHFKYILSNLPSGFSMWMGISTNYLQLKTIYNQRKHHKLDEWKYFCNWVESLPMNDLIIEKVSKK